MFGESGDHTHVVEIDFTSCYEFIDHADLRRELSLRSFDYDAISKLMETVLSVGHHGRGLPQMLEASDRLADTYLSIVDRQLTRHGYPIHRYADDIRVLASNWESANEIIESTASVGRSLGLVLSSEKTSIRLKETIAESNKSRTASIIAALDLSTTDSTDFDFGPYSEPLQPSGDDTSAQLTESMKRILSDWQAKFSESRKSQGAYQRKTDIDFLISAAVILLSGNEEELESQLVADLAFDSPLRSEIICRYFMLRNQKGLTVSDALFARATEASERSPWSKLWLLHTACDLGVSRPDIVTWTRKQLNDSHEIVRAEALWTLTLLDELSLDDVSRLYRSATRVSAPALAAATAYWDHKTGSKESKRLSEALDGDSLLNRKASQWARSLTQKS
ncbi:hypothetical protein GCM10009624_34310 [Gordonia sinesedis]